MNIETENRIVELYISGLSGDKIANLIGCKKHQVYYILKKNSINRRKNSDNSKVFDFNENYFERIDSEDKAYWLGFLMADGCVYSDRNKISLMLHNDDILHLEKFKESINSNYNIKTYENKLGAKFSRIIINSEKTKSDLINHGCIPKKSLVLKFPNIEEFLINHFIRGYFDGDGSLSISKDQFKFRMCGTKEFLEEVLNKIGFKNKLLRRWPDRNNNNYDIDIGGNLQVLKICNYLYKDATIFLDRKYDRYKMLQSRYQATDK